MKRSVVNTGRRHHFIRSALPASPEPRVRLRHGGGSRESLVLQKLEHKWHCVTALCISAAARSVESRRCIVLKSRVKSISVAPVAGCHGSGSGLPKICLFDKVQGASVSHRGEMATARIRGPSTRWLELGAPRVASLSHRPDLLVMPSPNAR